MIKKHKFQGLYVLEKGKRKAFVTKSLVPRFKVYDEDLIRDKGVEYRSWNPKKSKLGAALAKGISQIGLSLRLVLSNFLL